MSDENLPADRAEFDIALNALRLTLGHVRGAQAMALGVFTLLHGTGAQPYALATAAHFADVIAWIERQVAALEPLKITAPADGAQPAEATESVLH